MRGLAAPSSASTLGWALDLFDLFILLYVAPVVGALFFPSDSIRATKRFVRSRPYDEVAVIVTDHLGQLAIIWGVLMAFSGLTQS